MSMKLGGQIRTKKDQSGWINLPVKGNEVPRVAPILFNIRNIRTRNLWFPLKAIFSKVGGSVFRP